MRLKFAALGLALVLAGCGSDDSTTTTASEPPDTVRTEEFHKTNAPPVKENSVRPKHGSGGAAVLGPGADASWQKLEGEVAAKIGLALEPFGPGQLEAFGPLQEGHAWSSIKVPILVTLMRENDGNLSAEEESWARSALTASDNEAAAALFDQIEAKQGGLEGASLAVQDTLRAAGDNSTVVATAPPPPGAVSTYGQTEWSLPGSVAFFRSLGRGCLLSGSGTDYVLGLMGEVIPEQQWGLGEAGFPSPGGSASRPAGARRARNWGPTWCASPAS